MRKLIFFVSTKINEIAFHKFKIERRKMKASLYVERKIKINYEK